MSIIKEVSNLASLSSKYLINDNRLTDINKDIKAAEVNALAYSTGTDLVHLLIASEVGMDRLSVIFDSEANA